MCIAVDEAGFVAPLPEGTGAPVEMIDVTNILAPDILHEVRHPMFLHRRHQQVDMVGHQDIGVQPAVVALGCLGKITEITLTVPPTMKARFAVIAALHDMLGNADQVKTGLAGHEPPPWGEEEILTLLRSSTAN